MSTISLVDLEITCIIGIHPHERVEEQNIYLDINLDIDYQDSAHSDDINKTIDYTKIAQLATELAISKKYQLIESLCCELNDLLLDKFEIIQQSTITVKKPNALPKAKYASYSLKRSRL
tara:strand:+ start:99 stop:455 length:357 start_codon:yes stop_codon:yes gene_type:complete